MYWFSIIGCITSGFLLILLIFGLYKNYSDNTEAVLSSEIMRMPLVSQNRSFPDSVWSSLSPVEKDQVIQGGIIPPYITDKVKKIKNPCNTQEQNLESCRMATSGMSYTPSLSMGTGITTGVYDTRNLPI